MKKIDILGIVIAITLLFAFVLNTIIYLNLNRPTYDPKLHKAFNELTFGSLLFLISFFVIYIDLSSQENGLFSKQRIRAPGLFIIWLIFSFFTGVGAIIRGIITVYQNLL